MVRAFVGIGLAPLAPALSGLIDGLRSSGADAKYVEPANLHVNLRFLGEFGEARALPLSAALEGVALRTAPFPLHVRGAGAFPSPRQPRVAWAGLEPSPALDALQREVEHACEGAGFAREGRGFSPHVTLARVRSGRGLDALASTLRRLADVEVGTLEVASFALVQSTLTPEGPRYSPLSTHRLAGGTG